MSETACRDQKLAFRTGHNRHSPSEHCLATSQGEYNAGKIVVSFGADENCNWPRQHHAVDETLQDVRMMARDGSYARNIAGYVPIFIAPVTAIRANHTNVTGANRKPRRAVPSG